MSRLALVIPAYKCIFLKGALDSIANQTCKDFTLYIGDDHSPDNLFEIVEPYKKLINIKYKHFEKNLGGTDLVAHWERCIDLTENEEWIWLFSDDDLMDLNCVDSFYAALSSCTDADLFHFNMQCIDEQNNHVGKVNSFPKVFQVEDFLINKLQFRISSSVVEYVFKKSHFLNNGRFENFDLAWCSDDATWIKLGRKNGIHNINSALVYWRSSKHNISNINWDKKIIERKLNSQIEFVIWILDLATKKNVSIEISPLKKHLSSWLKITIKGNIDCIPFSSIRTIIAKCNLATNKSSWRGFEFLFLYPYKTCHSLLKGFYN